MAKANQLLDELSVQKKLLEIQNSETINNVQLLIDMIRKHFNLPISISNKNDYRKETHCGKESMAKTTRSPQTRSLCFGFPPRV